MIGEEFLIRCQYFYITQSNNLQFQGTLIDCSIVDPLSLQNLQMALFFTEFNRTETFKIEGWSKSYYWTISLANTTQEEEDTIQNQLIACTTRESFVLANYIVQVCPNPDPLSVPPGEYSALLLWDYTDLAPSEDMEVTIDRFFLTTPKNFQKCSDGTNNSLLIIDVLENPASNARDQTDGLYWNFIFLIQQSARNSLCTCNILLPDLFNASAQPFVCQKQYLYQGIVSKLPIRYESLSYLLQKTDRIYLYVSSCSVINVFQFSLKL